MAKGILVLKGKGEVVGNLVAGRLERRGIEFFSCGEYFEARPLLRIDEPKSLSVKEHKWIDGVAYRISVLGGMTVKEMLAAHEDTLVYTITNSGSSRIRIRLVGGLQAFSWFNPRFRRRISKLAGVRFEYAERHLGGVYGGKFFISLTVNRKMVVKAGEGQASYRIEDELSPGDMFVLSIAGASSEDEARSRAKEASADPSKIEEERKREVGAFLRRIRTIALKDVKPEYRRLWEYMWYVIRFNRASVCNHPILSNPFNMPSKFVFRHQWLWDSAFHAVVLSEYDVRMAEEELLNLFNAQKPDGRIPHEVFLSKEFCRLFWGVDDYSPWTTQPPVLAIAVKRIAERGGSRRFLKRAFEALDRYDAWFREYRDADGDQLMAYVDYLESGWDNAVRWDEAVALFRKKSKYYRTLYRDIRMAPVEAVDLNCFVYLQRITLSELAEALGVDRKAYEYRQLADKTAEGIRRLMWDPATGFYYDILEEDHRKVKVKSPAAFIALYAGIATQEQAEELVKHLMDPREFWTKFPLPTVSADDPKYDPRGYWRGRSWINQLWFTYHGLRRYNFEEEARLLAERALDIMSQGPTCNENYDSSTGEPLGAPDFGWSTLMLTIMADLYGTGEQSLS